MWGIFVAASTGVAWMLTISSCSTILGIERGLPFEDGGGLADGTNAPPPGDGENDSGCDAGKTNFICNGRCGTVLDSCGNEVDCGTTCAGSRVCNEAKQECECSALNWCHGRCGKSIDYCGVEQTCMCPAGSTCNLLTGLCGNCVPNPSACNGKNCGYADNGCAKQTCGTCGPDQHCRYVPASNTAGTCCTPKLPEELCAGRCAGTVVDSCTDRVTDCATVNHCAETEQCTNNTCCLRDGQPCDPATSRCCSTKCESPPADPDAGDGAVNPPVCVP